ncbi:hypothetical protein PCASD_16838 [Puccinia coronata f. sp. avenae]|uniref:Uncharacterized protein n=1 Tax=Puccinia coronata f. sp. avenae TaxID=200324 RepID=A0A2N5U4N7_9BASI|nr:hypothetical protein PCASD_16838 [Puccinia coronata f. sp. avenae]
MAPGKEFFTSGLLFMHGSIPTPMLRFAFATPHLPSTILHPSTANFAVLGLRSIITSTKISMTNGLGAIDHRKKTQVRCIFGERYGVVCPPQDLTVGARFKYYGCAQLVQRASIQLIVVLKDPRLFSALYSHLDGI